jgi:hypothetical protein
LFPPHPAPLPEGEGVLAPARRFAHAGAILLVGHRRLLAVKKMAAWTGVAAFVALSVIGCEQKPGRTPGQAAAALKGLVRFRPPADGLITQTELDRYIRVRRGSRGRTEVEAARAVGVDLDEYAWVRARVIEALVALDTRKVRAASEETYVKTIAALRRARQDSRVGQRTLEEQIAALERERASLKQIDTPPVAVALNAKRVAPRRAEIEALSP